MAEPPPPPEAEAEAEHMLRIAADLERVLAPLRGILDPLEARHTRAVWAGRAATASRSRLSGHRHRHRIAIEAIDHLVDDLRLAATHRARTAVALRRDPQEPFGPF